MKARAVKTDIGSNRQRAGELSPVICWTRMQAEAGQNLDAIVTRKDLEREAGDGLFCWGIGNAPPRSLNETVRRGIDIDVVFSMMKSRPKSSDVTPSGLVVWRSYFDFDGVERPLPPNVLITSGPKASRRAHYALMCHADQQLKLADLGAFDPTAYLNVSEAARPVGASQVTALLRRVAGERENASYRINLRASLTQSSWVKLGRPLELTARRRAELMEMLRCLEEMTKTDWLQMVLGIRSERRGRNKRPEKQLLLFGG